MTAPSDKQNFSAARVTITVTVLLWYQRRVGSTCTVSSNYSEEGFLFVGPCLALKDSEAEVYAGIK